MPLPPTLRLLPSRLCAQPRLTVHKRPFSHSAVSAKALAHTLPGPSYGHPHGRDAQIAATMKAQPPSSRGAREVVRGEKRGRTMEKLSLEGKRCVVTHPHSSISLTLASSLLEAGANDLVLLSTPSSRSTAPDQALLSTSSDLSPSFETAGSGPYPAPGEQLRRLAREKGWEGVKVTEIELEKGEVEALDKCVTECEDVLGGKVDVLLAGPPMDVEDTAACLALLTHFCRLMASPPSTSLYDPPTTSRSLILLSSLYGPRVDLPQPQLAPHQSPAKRGAREVKRKAGAGEMSWASGVLGVQWAKRGVRVNCISPGFLRTPEISSFLHSDPSLPEKWQNATPLGRVGGVEELKGAAVYLAGDSSRFTTGTTLVVDGGYSIV
ncbi:hypothetical protein JCM11251_006361 [Rhodosporidiobolus azoricus]